MFLGMIFYRVMKNVAVVEDGLKIGGEKGEKLVSSDSYFEGGIGDKFEG